MGSVHPLQCWFQSDLGPRYPYYGLVRRVGLDIGFTQQSTLGWVVFAPTRRIGPGDLSGNYAGVTAGAALVIGGNANALVGGSDNSFALQPLSFEGQTGLNIAAWASPISSCAQRGRVTPTLRMNFTAKQGSTITAGECCENRPAISLASTSNTEVLTG